MVACPVCQRTYDPGRIQLLCPLCSESLRRTERNDGTIFATIEWTAKRAIRFERLRARDVRKRHGKDG